ncbi:hypothetical protein [Marinobacter sp. JSM 1782161]|uniref:hypothetical protein n=1 Tax=Marinobacter sp. JSM 1782161 TaxID=2685906 RepID=UPI00140253E9|nr:hypothetical protein [Marinobacter sp. JSM 1782161]
MDLKNVSEPAWEPGLRRTVKNGHILALSPVPATTAARAVDVNHWLRRKSDVWLDLQGGNLLFSAELSLMFLSLSFLTIMAGIGLTTAIGVEQGRLKWDMPLFVFICNLLVSLPWGLYVHFQANQAVKNAPPIRLNRQRRQVAIPRWTEDQVTNLRFWGKKSGIRVYLLLVFTCVSVFAPLFQDVGSPEYTRTLVASSLTVLVIELLLVGVYVLYGLRLKQKIGSRIVYEIYPWEKLVAFIENQTNLGPNLMTQTAVLTLAIPREDDPETALAAARINVGHETAGLAQWECIRRFMEDGPDACPDPRNDETLANYKANCRKARQEMSFLPWLGKKVGDWFFQRYLAHIVTERRSRKIALKGVPDELKAWSESLPESQWAQPSETLQKTNERLSKAYARGLNFAEMGPLSQWADGAEEKQQRGGRKGRPVKSSQ